MDLMAIHIPHRIRKDVNNISFIFSFVSNSVISPKTKLEHSNIKRAMERITPKPPVEFAKQKITKARIRLPFQFFLYNQSTHKAVGGSGNRGLPMACPPASGKAFGLAAATRFNCHFLSHTHVSNPPFHIRLATRQRAIRQFLIRLCATGYWPAGGDVL